MGETASKIQTFTPPMRFEFPLEVLEPDDEAVADEYEDLIERACMRATTPEQWEERAHAVELIVYAHESLALPFQLRMLTGEVPLGKPVFNDCHVIDLATYFIEKNSAEVAQGLADVFLDLSAQTRELDRIDRTFLSEIVLWTIHELHSRGNTEIIRITDDIVADFPKPRDPRLLLSFP